MIEKISYADARNRMQSGDAILKAGKSIISFAIGLWSPKNILDKAGNIIDARLTHAALIVRMDDYIRNHEVFVVEASNHGLVPRILSEQIKGSDSRWFWLKTNMTEDQRFLSREIALLWSAKGIKYDFQGLVANAFGRVSLDASEFWCSEWLDFDWTQCGFIDWGMHGMRPWDIPQYGIVREIYL